MFNSLFFDNIPFYETIWKNTVQPNESHMTTFSTHTACWMPKATNTHSEYVKLIAFPLQQWLKERDCVLRYTYIVCLVEWYNTEYNTGCDMTDAEFCVFPGHVTPRVIL
jgi:hypothetical protein